MFAVNLELSFCSEPYNAIQSRSKLPKCYVDIIRI